MVIDNAVNQRINKLIEGLGGNKNLFASKLGIHPSIIYNILKGRNKPSYDLLEKMVTIFKINPIWLILGKGDMFLSFEIYMDDNTLILEIDKYLKKFKILIGNLDFLIKMIHEQFSIDDIELNEEFKILNLFDEKAKDSILMTRDAREELMNKIKGVNELLIGKFIDLFLVYRRCIENPTLNAKEAFFIYLKIPDSLNYEDFKTFTH
jgi:transcriptional regulator with XRE-family HTH domain